MTLPTELHMVTKPDTNLAKFPPISYLIWKIIEALGYDLGSSPGFVTSGGFTDELRSSGGFR